MGTMQLQLDLDTAANGRRNQVRDESIAARLAKGPTGEDRLMEMGIWDFS